MNIPRDECKAQVDKFTGAAFKKFNTETECNKFIAEKSGDSTVTATEPSKVTTPVTIPNPVAQKALLTKPSGSKLPPSGRQRTAKFTAPQPTTSSTADPDKAFLVNLGNSLKRHSTPYHDTRKTKLGRYDFDTDQLGYVQVYTDGSCVNNGKRGAKAGLGVYFGEDHPL